ncbi:MAG: DUF2905 domain-containing protein [bacterium]
MNIQNLGRLLFSLGLLITFMGIIIYIFGSNFSWLGNLPGDIKIEGDSFTLYFPLTTMIIISVVLNLLFRVFNFFF